MSLTLRKRRSPGAIFLGSGRGASLREQPGPDAAPSSSAGGEGSAEPEGATRAGRGEYVTWPGWATGAQFFARGFTQAVFSELVCLRSVFIEYIPGTQQFYKTK